MDKTRTTATAKFSLKLCQKPIKYAHIKTETDILPANFDSTSIVYRLF